MEHPKPTLYGVFGHPVGHSLSPAIHRAAYQAMGWTHRHYVPVDVEGDRLAAAISAFGEVGGRGINLTIPLKTLALAVPGVHSRDAWALRTGAVNTLARRPDGSWDAFNTDGPALHAALVRRGVVGARVLVYGGGGAARASVLAVLGTAAEVVLAARSGASWMKSLSARSCREVPWAEANRWVGWADVVINATPLGQAGGPAWDPLPQFRPDQWVVDWVYADGATVLVEQAARDGAGVVDGRELLIRQAAGAWAHWFVEAPPLGAMARCVGLAEGVVASP